jgi:predicted PolB exonuclease-like 3'-5' exonuclease
MGFDNEFSLPIVFDLETVPIDGAEAYLKPPSNYKDPEKIAAYLEDKASMLALDIDLCRIVAIGYQSPKDDEPTVFAVPDEAVEAEALKRFWKHIGDRPLLGFNCVQFDAPLLMRRSLYLNVWTPPLQISKYRHPRIQDLMQILAFDGLQKYHGLKFYAKRFGIEEPDPFDGGDIGQLVKDGKWEDVASHCRADVKQTLALARRIGLLPQAVTERLF